MYKLWKKNVEIRRNRPPTKSRKWRNSKSQEGHRRKYGGWRQVTQFHGWVNKMRKWKRTPMTQKKGR
ncbi:Protein CBG28005 [Caenorhabditis briggsae]|uniref:Protein CBG28005 n=1 Tax=Caenorhabditis briggsae TaxID=6238 RepID=B6IM66_CAEBR|nr:Protein CBG28005 [Caenorhabditis briggsae]CAS00996.1 Protein CBG28005 [Caenorhabditis briggsae]